MTVTKLLDYYFSACIPFSFLFHYSVKKSFMFIGIIMSHLLFLFFLHYAFSKYNEINNVLAEALLLALGSNKKPKLA